MRFVIYISIVLALAACVKPDIRKEAEEKISVQGVLSNENFQGILVKRIEVFGNSTIGEEVISNANVQISNSTEEAQLEFVEGRYILNSEDMDIVPGLVYTLSVEVDGKLLYSQCKIPPSIAFTFVSGSDVVIDPENPGDPVLFMEWTNHDNHEYVLSLNEPDNAIEIPFETEAGMFNESFAFPLLEPSTLVYDLDFRFYGDHQIFIHCVPEEYASIFFMKPEVIGQEVINGPNNITGGVGYFVGASVIALDVEVN